MKLWLPEQWYKTHSWIRVFAPLAWLYQTGLFLRKKAYDFGLLPKNYFPVPVIVVGNITVGGTGKTPLVMAIARDLQQAGFNPGIVSRGYQGKAAVYPCVVLPNSKASDVGDEALEIKLNTGLPVIVAPNRSSAVKMLLATTNTNVVLCDDGLQHYALQRSLDIGVIDGARRFGNGWCLPVGPCREPAKRWLQLPIRVCNGKALAGEYAMQMQAVEFVNVQDSSHRLPITAFAGQKVQAVTGLGNPQRFLTLLSQLEIDYDAKTFPDHHAFGATDFNLNEITPVIMTGKDAVKCREFAGKNWWFLSVIAECDPALLTSIRNHIATIA